MTSVGGGFSESSSHPVMFDPFGSMPFSAAGGLFKQFSDPLMKGFGYGPGGTGPLGNFISQMTGQGGPLASFLPAMSNLSTQLTQGANSAFGGYQTAIDNFMKQLPGFQDTMASATAGAQGASTAANTALQDAMSPLQSRASFQEASRRALAPAREGEAARGMVEGGQAQGGEQSLLSDLAFQQLQADKANQQQAIAGASGAAGNLGSLAGGGAQLAGLGPEMMGSLFSAYPQLASMLTGAAGLPMQAGSDLLNFFQQANNPMMALLQLIRPQMGQASSSFGMQTQV